MGVSECDGFVYNAKLQNLEVPEELWDDERFERVMWYHINDRARLFLDDLKQQFPWIAEAYQCGRSGGWICVEPKDWFYDYLAFAESVIEDPKNFDFYAEHYLGDVGRVKEYTQRFLEVLEDAKTIQDWVKAAVLELEDPEYWRAFAEEMGYL